MKIKNCTLNNKTTNKNSTNIDCSIQVNKSNKNPIYTVVKGLSGFQSTDHMIQLPDNVILDVDDEFEIINADGILTITGIVSKVRPHNTYAFAGEILTDT